MLRAGNSRAGSGSILVGLLWCLALLSLIVIGVLHSSRLDLRATKNYGDVIQARYLALAGVEKAKALLYLEALARQRSAQHHSGKLYDAAAEFQDVALGRGRFRVFRQGSREEGGQVVYGIRDEESRLNANSASAEELSRLNGITSDVVAAIIDWRDADNTVTPGGAEAEYYLSLQPPRRPRNGPLPSVRELLMVRGVPRDLFCGEDANFNGLLDPSEDDGAASFPPDNRDGILDGGWSELLTVFSSTGNQNAAGTDRVNVQTADEKTLSSVRGISPELARAIVASRAQNRLDCLADLLEVSAPSPASAIRPPVNAIQNPSPLNPAQAPPARTAPVSAGNSSPGPKLINEDLLSEIADDLTTQTEGRQTGLININTAGVEVLACLAGVDRELARNIVAYRQSAGFFPNVAWLLKVDGMTRPLFKQLSPKITTRSETFRILSEGKVNESGARQRIETVIRISPGNVETLSYREDL